MILTATHTSGMLHPMRSLLQTGSSRITAFAGRDQLKSDFLSVSEEIPSLAGCPQGGVGSLDEQELA